MTATSAAKSPSKGRIIAARPARLGVLLLVVSILSTYVKREALDAGQFRKTAQQLIADPAIQEAVAAQMTDALRTSTSRDRSRPSCRRTSRLSRPDRRPRPGLRGHGGGEPARPAAHSGCVRRPRRALPDAVCQGAARRNEGGGHVERRCRPRHPAARPEAGRSVRVRRRSRRPDPPGAGQVTILEQTISTRPRRSRTGSSRSRTTSRSSHSPPWSARSGWPAAPAAGGSLAWHRSRRCRPHRARRPLARRQVHRRPARRHRLDAAGGPRAWQIITQSLAAAGWVALVVGILVAIGAWLVGPGDRATASRAALAPHLRRPEIAWSAFVVGMLLLIWLFPIQVFRTTAVLVVASVSASSSSCASSRRSRPHRRPASPNHPLRHEWTGRASGSAHAAGRSRRTGRGARPRGPSSRRRGAAASSSACSRPGSENGSTFPQSSQTRWWWCSPPRVTARSGRSRHRARPAGRGCSSTSWSSAR